jgi:ElaB/YqjD/DUF883 family membrane-anchored ribosome-binding protein
MGKKRKAEKLAEAAAEGARHAAEEAVDAVEDGFDVAHRFLKQQLKERPAMVIGAAAAFGMVLGALFAGGRR